MGGIGELIRFIKFISIVLFRVLLFCVVLVLGLFLIMNIAGGPLVSKLAQAIFHKPLKIEKLYLSPRRIRAYGLSYSDIVDIGRAELIFHLYPFLVESVVLDSARFRWQLDNRDPNRNSAGQYPGIKALAVIMGLPVQDITVNNGVLDLYRKKQTEARVEFSARIYRPSVNIHYYNMDLSSKIYSHQYVGQGSVKGWLDWDNKNADIDLDVHSLDLTLLEYFFNLPDMEGLIDIGIKARAKANKLVMENTIALHKFSYNSLATKVPVISSLMPVVNSLKEPDLKFNFRVTTKLDSPKFNFKKYILSALMDQKKVVSDSSDSDDERQDKGEIYDIINDFVGVVGSVIDSVVGEKK